MIKIGSWAITSSSKRICLLCWYEVIGLRSNLLVLLYSSFVLNIFVFWQYSKFNCYFVFNVLYYYNKFLSIIDGISKVYYNINFSIGYSESSNWRITGKSNFNSRYNDLTNLEYYCYSGKRTLYFWNGWHFHEIGWSLRCVHPI